MIKWLSLLAIIIAEFIFIFLEIFSANKFKDVGNSELVRYFLLLSPLIIISSVLLILGYIYGYRAFNKIWVVTIISWSAIVIIEPILNYLIFKELPGGKTLIAGILALGAIIISIL